MDVSIQDDQIDGPHGSIPVRRYEPVRTNGVTTTPTLVWLHGGAFFAGGLNLPEADNVARALAGRGHPVVTVSYRLAPFPVVGSLGSRRRKPSNRYPAPVDDVLAVVQHLGERSGGAIVVGGASAGACIAAGTALRYQQQGGRLAGVLSAYGFFHFTQPRSGVTHLRPQGHRRITHSRWALNEMNRNYLGRTSDPTDRYAFPGGGDVQGFPSALIINAERDSMRASAELFATELAAAGSPAEQHLIAGSKHAFLNRPHSEDFTVGVNLISAWLDSISLSSLDEAARSSILE